jgi:hypothetical protein
MKVIIKTRVVCTKVDIHLFYIVVIDTRMCLGIFLYTRSIGGRHTVLPLSVLRRNLTGPKTLPTIWHTYMKLVTKFNISVVNSC